MKHPNVKFTVECEMNARWVPHFISMLKYMQQLGNIGASRTVSFVADGDGDFRPKFKFDDTLPSLKSVEPIIDNGGDRTYDAG